jgi:hypothetical protein
LKMEERFPQRIKRLKKLQRNRYYTKSVIS